MHNRSPENNCFIYGPMTREAADAILVNKIKLLSAEKAAALKADPNAKVWLLRESQHNGFLTFHSASWDAINEQWKLAGPERLALTSTGWAIITSPEQHAAIKHKITKVKATDFATYAPQLIQYVEGHLNLHIENRINPESTQRTQNNIYSIYSVEDDNDRRKRQKTKTELDLPDDILTAITCSVTNKIFKDAVVSLKTIPQHKLHRGHSYERSALEEMKLEENLDFIPNHKLNLIVNYLGAQENKLEKLKKIAEHEIKDAIDFENITNAHITAAGQTYSLHTISQYIELKGDIAKDPINPNIPISLDTLVPNMNFNIFMSGWKRYYKERSAELQRVEEKPEAPRSPRPF
jgi:hypothetical protein